MRHEMVYCRYFIELNVAHGDQCRLRFRSIAAQHRLHLTGFDGGTGRALCQFSSYDDLVAPPVPAVGEPFRWAV